LTRAHIQELHIDISVLLLVTGYKIPQQILTVGRIDEEPASAGSSGFVTGSEETEDTAKK
jgi:hypothetical protein